MQCETIISAHGGAPEQPCVLDATMLARSMREVVDGEAATWKRIEDHFYCVYHFQPGRMEHIDGRVTQHAPMSAEDA